MGMSGASCSDLERYVQWLEEFAGLCRPKEERTFFEDCTWVQCDCLWGSLSAPVPDSEVVACFEQGMKVERISKYAQQFTFALMQTCRARTLTLSEPCGECDRYRLERPECQPPTAEELMRRNGSLNATNLTNGTLGEKEAGSKSAKSFAVAARTRRAGGLLEVLLLLPLLLLFSPKQQDH